MQTVFLIILVYAVLPTVLIRLLSLGALSRAPGGGGRIALTFDDGPDPRYTPQILDILKRHKAKACFFIVGSKARAHPELVKQIALDGHEIGNHGFRHKAAWLLGPAATTREIRETNLAIEELTGKKARFCRPAWGLFNLFSVGYCRFKGLKVVLWTFMSWDWAKKATPESIARRVIGKIRDGAILIFHDSDSNIGAAEGSPARVVAALPHILEGVRQKGLRIATLEEIADMRTGRLKKVILRVWSLTDSAIRAVSGIKDIDGKNPFIFRFALRRHRGGDREVCDGVLLRRGDRYLELHINNELLLRQIGENASLERMAVKSMREVRNGLPALARFLSSNERFREISVILGISLLHRPAESLGFRVYDMKPGLLRTLTGCYQRFLLSVYRPGGSSRYREKLTPKIIVITRDELMRRYLPVEDAAFRCKNPAG
ncbi:MAG TPA: polysaccharide deacetylase family protein [Bacillota bacterium]|nr:polysaccharide deacetylase family protein [Bacillota bacterium]